MNSSGFQFAEAILIPIQTSIETEIIIIKLKIYHLKVLKKLIKKFSEFFEFLAKSLTGISSSSHEIIPSFISLLPEVPQFTFIEAEA